MAALIITRQHLEPFANIPAAKADAMIEDALAVLPRIAPCLVDLDEGDPLVGEARAIIRRAILRWNDAGTGAVTQQTAGPYSQSIDTRTTQSRNLFWPSEINALRALCGPSGGGAYMIDLTGLGTPQHPLQGAWVNGPDGYAPRESP